MFSFTEITNGSENIDTENAEYQVAAIDGHIGAVISKNDGLEIHWFDGSTLFIVYIRSQSIPEAISYAEGVRKIVE